MLTLSALQMQPYSCDKAENLAVIRSAAQAAADLGSALLVTPEMSLTGYASFKRMQELAEPRDGYMVDTLLDIAHKSNIAVVAGLPERDGDDIFNSAVCALPSGKTYFYRKCHLFGPYELKSFKKGHAISPIFQIGEMQAGMLICYDVEFPEWTRSLALAGAELFIVPTALPLGPENDRVSRLMVPTRALENHVSIVYAGLCGAEGKIGYQGGSCIVGPDGVDLVRAGTQPSLLTTRVQKAPAAEAMTDPYLTDRRPDLYQRLHAN